VILGIIQARMSSSRLPGKVLAPILGRPMLALQVERVLRAQTLDKLLVATSTDPSDDPLPAECRSAGVECFRGSLDDVLDRFHAAATAYDAGHIMRLTGDCPLSDPHLIDEVVKLHLEGAYDYTSNVYPRTFPDGLDIEVATMPTIEMAWREADRMAEREHVTIWIRENEERFRIGNLALERDLSRCRWTVDEPADFSFVSRIYEELYPNKPDFGMEDIIALLEQHPELKKINRSTRPDEYAPAPRSEQ
jgi:spore coat polysaccharide biosynthesis protein SpsF